MEAKESGRRHISKGARQALLGGGADVQGSGRSLEVPVEGALAGSHGSCASSTREDVEIGTCKLSSSSCRTTRLWICPRPPRAYRGWSWLIARGCVTEVSWLCREALERTRECAPLAKAGFVCLLVRFGRRMFCANLHWQALEVMLALYRLFLSSASCSAWRGRGRGL